MRSKCANNNVLEQHIHVLSYACFFQKNTAMFSAKSVYCHRFGWGGCLCVCLCVQCRSLSARLVCQCVFDFANVRCMCVHCMSICNTPETGHIYPLYWVHLDARTVVPPGQCLLKQHHSLIFNNLLNAVSWRSFFHHVSHFFN